MKKQKNVLNAVRGKNPKNTVVDEEAPLTRIDRNRLGDEWNSQVKMTLYYGDLLAKAKKELDETKNEWEVVRADFSKNIRTRPGKYGIEKVTEGSVSDEISVQMSSHPVQQKLIDLKYKVNLFQAWMLALDARKKALSDVIFLLSIQYFAEPKTPKGENAKKVVEKMKDRMTRGLRNDEGDDD